MNTRLQQFLQLENLSPARLADILGVQRSGMSHILSGRNKPGYDFIYKLLMKFPDLNADWFLTGRGKPYKKTESDLPKSNGSAADSENGSSPIREERKLTDMSPQKEENNGNFENINIIPLDLFTDATSVNNTYYSVNEKIEQKTVPQHPRENQKFAESCTQAGEKRTAKKVIIFYNDGSFEELLPADHSISDLK